jgi:hypothetical protein
MSTMCLCFDLHILNYRTVATQSDLETGKIRMTLWMAPALSCFALRATIEERQADGNWKLLSEKKASKITINH